MSNLLRGSVMAARNFHKVEDHVRLWRPQPILFFDLRCTQPKKNIEGHALAMSYLSDAKREAEENRAVIVLRKIGHLVQFQLALVAEGTTA